MIADVIALFIHTHVGLIVLAEVYVIVLKGVPLQTLPTDATSLDLYLPPLAPIMV